MKQVFPEPTVGVLILNTEGRMFLTKSHKWKNMYVLPGGHIELGERMIDTVEREVMEETGLKIFDIRFINFQEFIYDKNFWKKRHFLFFNFACKTKSKKVKLNDEAESFVWVYPKEALKMFVEPYSIDIIKDFLKKYPNGF